jgi:hypothetical protein
MPSSQTRAALIPFWAWAAIPLLLAAWLRVRGIGGPEAFVDEGAFILTALDTRVHDLFAPLGQGRPWAGYLFKPAGWLPAHALEIARTMAAFAGVTTAFALGWALLRLSGRAAALCGLWLWAVLPLAVFHERLALQDPFVTACLACALAALVTGNLRPDHPRSWPSFVAAGVFFGAAFLLKISALFALPWLGLIHLEMQRRAARPVFDRRLAWIALGALVPLLSLGSGLPHLGADLGRYEVLPTAGGAGFFAAWLVRLGLVVQWYFGYGGWPLLVLAAGATAIACYLRQRLLFTCAMGWLLSLFVSTLAYRAPYARYLVVDHLPLVLLLALAAAAALAIAGRLRVIAAMLLAVALGRWGLVSWGVGSDPTKAPGPPDEIAQYFTGPWSGRGVGEVRRYLTDYADRHGVRCLVITHRFLRPGCYGLLLAELGDPRIGVVPLTLYEPQQLAAARPGLRHAAAGQRVAFFILYEGSLYPAHPWLDAPAGTTRLVLAVPRGPGESFSLYQFEP